MDKSSRYSVSRYPVWLIITCGCAIALLAFGPRSAMGFFQEPILNDRGWGSTTFGLALAIQNLGWGIGQPIFGAIADRWGAYKALAGGAILYALGLWMMGMAPTPLWFHLSAGVLVGMGVAAGSFGLILSIFARNVSAEQRSFVFGLGTAAGSAGMFVFSFLTVAFIDGWGWVQATIILSMMMLLIPMLAIPLAGNSKNTKEQNVFKQSVGQALKEALGHKSYLLLTSGFFVCGFQVAFITAHFPKFLADKNIDTQYAVWAIALIGLFNIFGSLASGMIGQRYSKPYFLAIIYVARSIVVATFLLLPITPLSVIIFSILMGLLWLSTVPPTNALVAIMFGTGHLGMLGGIVFFSHQIGSFLGVAMGGYLRDAYGSYDVVWWLGVALGLFAAIVHWPIKESAVQRSI